ncbi:hypothetical protein, partial [Salmonella sp. SAL4432]|uniref:hypothetical protein n=1 Tax=Salmonella sp. SAL4432 TaxID=3159887 RepID=UPI00397A3F72
TSIDSESTTQYDPGASRPPVPFEVNLAAFRDYGVELNDVNSAPDVERIARVVEQIRRSAIRDRLVEGLDDWPAETLMRNQELLAVLK